jgi:hypothetical protein
LCGIINKIKAAEEKAMRKTHWSEVYCARAKKLET